MQTQANRLEKLAPINSRKHMQRNLHILYLLSATTEDTSV